VFSHPPRLAFALLALLVSLAPADMIELDNGSLLVGEVTAVRQGKITLKTDFSGTLSIPLERVVSLRTDGPLRVAVAERGEAVGPVVLTGTQIEVRDPAAPLVAATTDLLAAGPSDQPLVLGPPPPPPPRWTYEASAAYRAKRGNTENSRLHLGAAAEKKWDKEKLKLYATWTQAEDKNRKTEDEMIGGVDFERQLNERFLWYARTELERDKIERISLRATLAGGLGWYAVRNENRELRLRSGLQYRRESFDNQAPDDDTFGLEFGARHTWRIAPWGRLVNEVVYSSDFDDWADYRVIHESSLDLPLVASKHWRLRLGLSHEYNSQVAANIERLDTTYFLRLVFNWK